MISKSNVENCATCATVRHPENTSSSLTFVGSAIGESCHKPMRDAALEVYRRFLDIESAFVRDKIKHWMTCNVALLKAETAIEKEYQKAVKGDEDARENVSQGMDYWKALVMREIDRCLEESGSQP